MARIKLYRPDGSAVIEVGEENKDQLISMGWTDKKPATKQPKTEGK